MAFVAGVCWATQGLYAKQISSSAQRRKRDFLMMVLMETKYKMDSLSGIQNVMIGFVIGSMEAYDTYAPKR